MNTTRELIEAYYEGWQTGQFERRIFAEDFTFIGPLAQSRGPDQFFTMVEEMEQIVRVEYINFIGRFVNEEEGQACAIYDMITLTPVRTTTRCSELFTVEHGKIQSINLIYDAREWEASMSHNMAISI